MEDYERQQDLLKASFYYALLTSGTKGIPATEPRGPRNRKTSRPGAVHPELVRLWLGSLLSTVKECDPDFDDAVERAWREVIESAIERLPAGRRMRRPGH